MALDHLHQLLLQQPHPSINTLMAWKNDAIAHSVARSQWKEKRQRCLKSCVVRYKIYNWVQNVLIAVFIHHSCKILGPCMGKVLCSDSDDTRNSEFEVGIIGNMTVKTSVRLFSLFQRCLYYLPVYLTMHGSSAATVTTIILHALHSF